jgi:UDP-N-acetyl-2-amino-2-deoxyglucuronate dehydrogenase
VTVRIGIVGCGFIAGVHSIAIASLVNAGLVDAAVTATYDVDPARAQRLAAGHDACVCADVDALLGLVDVVWVCTWTAAHRDVVAMAVEAGVAVFCEKPLAPTLAECDEVASLLERVPHQVGLVLRHAPVFRAAADLVRSGTAGRPLATILRDDQYFPIQGMYGSDWRADVTRAGGGTLIEHSIHDLDVLRWILGDPITLQAHVASRFGYDGIDDVAQVTSVYEDGSLATLVSVWHQVTTRPSTRRLEVFCEDALLWTEDDYLGPLHVATSAGDELVLGVAPPWLDELGLAAELAVPVAQYAEPTKAFLDALAAEGPAATGWPDAQAALAAHRLVDAAYRSAAAGGAVERPQPSDR